MIDLQIAFYHALLSQYRGDEFSEVLARGGKKILTLTSTSEPSKTASTPSAAPTADIPSTKPPTGAPSAAFALSFLVLLCHLAGRLRRFV